MCMCESGTERKGNRERKVCVWGGGGRKDTKAIQRDIRKGIEKENTKSNNHNNHNGEKNIMVDMKPLRFCFRQSFSSWYRASLKINFLSWTSKYNQWSSQ